MKISDIWFCVKCKNVFKKPHESCPKCKTYGAVYTAFAFASNEACNKTLEYVTYKNTYNSEHIVAHYRSIGNLDMSLAHQFPEK